MPFGEELDDPFEIHEVILRSRNLKYPHLNDQNTKLFTIRDNEVICVR